MVVVLGLVVAGVVVVEVVHRVVAVSVEIEVDDDNNDVMTSLSLLLLSVQLYLSS